MDENYAFYSYESIQSDQIRLLQFNHESNHTSAILRTFTLKRLSTTYHALSYSWLGENSATNARQKHGVLKTEKGELPILDSVQDFVRVLKSKEGNFNDTWWWIDSICINLADTEERNQQVQLMSEIYRNAHEVIVWLGEETEQTENAFYFLQLLNETVRQERNLEKTRRMFQQPQYEPHWAALASFFQRRWWSRIWTLQEYAMNTNASFWWGMRSFSRSVVEGALIGADRCTSVGFKATPAFRHSFSRRRVRILYDTRQANNNRIQLTLVALAAYSSCFEATDDRDRLYGIQGLATDTSILEVNYSYDVEDTYMRFTKAFIEHYKSLDIICFASLYSSVHSSALPSWVPDWRARIDPLSVPLMVSQSAKDTIGNLRPSSLTVNVPGHSAPCYAASKESIPIYRFAELKLIARGTTVDVVDGLGGSTNIGMVQSSAKLNPVKSLFKGMTASDLLRSVCKSLVLDRKDRYMRFAMPADDFFRDFTWLCRHVTMDAPYLVPKEFAEWYLGTKDLLINGRSLETLLRESRAAANIELSSSAPNQDEYISDTFFGRFFDTVVRMSLRLMITRDGRIGLVSKKAKKGDLVAVLFGCSVPVVLRQTGEEENGTLTLVGECFLDGFMNGAGLTGPGREFSIE